ncbi:hypothetical protein RV18_GL001429 [Enterococcus termitis]|nr:hypothetical protein RV18_GL001429 [Enterococcus termitis]
MLIIGIIQLLKPASRKKDKNKLWQIAPYFIFPIFLSRLNGLFRFYFYPATQINP